MPHATPENAPLPSPAGSTPLPRLEDPALRRALDASDNAIVVSNAAKQVVYVTDGLTRMFGFQKEEVLGRQLDEVLLGPHSDPQLLRNIRSGLAQKGHCRTDTLLYSKSGQPRWVSMVINAANGSSGEGSSGGRGGSITVLTDITLTKMHEVLQTRVLKGLVHELPLPELMDLVCREVERIAPEVVASVLSVDGRGHLHPLAAPSLPAHVCDALDGVAIGPAVGSCGTAAYRNASVVVTDITTDPLWTDYKALFAPTGLRACWSSPIRDHRGAVVGTFAFYFREPREPDALHHRLVEVSLHLCALAIERDRTSQRLHELASFDVLTGLPNRAMFRRTAERALSELRERSQTAALLFVNLDRFKQVNESLGHAAGDALLSEVARRLTLFLRAHDLIGRLSGDEFVLMLSECSTPQAAHAAQRMLAAIAQPIELEGQFTVVHASVGIALYPDDGDSVDALLRHADQAMDQAKSDNGGGFRLFSAEMNRQAQERATLERDLRHALARRQLTLHYQPQVLSSCPDTVHGVEALARWQHPERGAVPPDQFIALAEETGLIHELTQWAIDEACTQLAQWRAAGLQVPCLSVNLSGRSFHRSGFAKDLCEEVRRHGLRPADLLLEITESVMLDARPETLANVSALNQAGFRLSLDDFGTGYSSLSYLHRLPIAELKLDMAFVRDLTTSHTARALTVSVLSIAHSLGMVVIAEGVETEGQQQWLQAHGCPVMQGYLFARPLPAQALAAWMSKRSRASA